MRLGVRDFKDLDAAIADGVYGDYIYMYPPRQAYRTLALSREHLIRTVRSSIEARPRLNLYLHIPFCNQICRFCNLYTTPLSTGSRELLSAYVQRLVAEARFYADNGMGQAGQWHTFYLGGGTPNSLPLTLMETLVAQVEQTFDLTGCEEFAIEVAPELATRDYLEGLKGLGFSRISMGLQTTHPGELVNVGRAYDLDRQEELANDIRELKFSNLCLDLIFGLPGQTINSWIASVERVIDLQPQTVCAYQWTSRPHTGFSRRGEVRHGGYELHEMYRVAGEILADSGYTQDTHVRWNRPGGGYLQKEYHWASDTLIGLGAGARTYLWNIDLRNGYSIRHRSSALSDYMASASEPTWLGAPQGFVMSEDERRRKGLVLGIHNLSRSAYFDDFDAEPLEMFSDLLDGLVSRGLVKVDGDRIGLTARGMANRDLIVQLFFSESVGVLSSTWDYDE